MSTVLYRKYRPDSFDGVIGQDHIISTLKNQILSGRIGHAYLFCGSRGVGKTSLARIFSRAINCQKLDSAPCNKCDSCKASKEENNLDIIEIDAASNNGVDDARDLREKVKYPPIGGKYKVYIIDEVHMLTGSAFNALLKTLEEPPSHAVFILATTEPHKLPATILSRCLRFDFHLVPMNMLYKLLAKIYEEENKEFESDALLAVAAAAEGSVRDALSIADMCINLSKGKLTLKDVSPILNTGGEKIINLLDRINAGDIKTSLTIINELAIMGKSMNSIAKEMAQYSRDLMIAKTAPQILETTNETKNQLIEKSKNFSISGLAALITLFSETESTLRYSISPKIAMESAIVRAIKMYSLDLNAIDERLLRLENQQALHKSNNNIISQSIENNVSTNNNNICNPSPAPVLNQLSAPQIWGRVITYFRKNSTPAFYQVVGRQDPQKLKIKDGVFIIFAKRADFLSMCDNALLEDLRKAFLDLGADYRINVEKDSADIDLEKEIESFKNEFGNKVKIT